MVKTRSIKAIIAGGGFILISFIVLQFVYTIFAAIYNDYSKDYPYLIEISLLIKTLIIIPSLLVIMFLGGYLTAVISHKKVLLHSFIVGLLVTGVSIWMMLDDSELSINGVIINGVMLLVILLGGYFRDRKVRTFDDYDDYVAD
jgi:hypothetical protein